MPKRIRLLLLASLLVITLIATGAGAAYAADKCYLQLYFDDNVSITYTTKYPDGKVLTAPQDVPIGGAHSSNPGAPGDLSSKQIYCIDPFVPFHNRVPDLGGRYEWDRTVGLMGDWINNYTAIAPWEMSEEMRNNVERVRWIVANGYREDYLSANKAFKNNGAISYSVTRMTTLTGINNIDETVALMATKVAIWKVLAGDNVNVESTSLNTQQFAAFDGLWKALVNGSLSPLTGVSFTTFDIKIVEDSVNKYSISNEPSPSDGNFYYGPLYIEINNGSAYNFPVDVYLTASGPDVTAVEFVEIVSGEYKEIINKGSIYGTTINDAQFLSMNPNDPVREFYFRIPYNARTPEFGDMLTIQARAVAKGVPIDENSGEGMPVAYVYDGSNGRGWDVIQAFIGWVEGPSVDLYAEAGFSTTTTETGNIEITKIVDNYPDNPSELGITPLDKEQLFTFKVLFDYDNNGVETLQLDVFDISGALNVDYAADTFQLKNNGKATIFGVPVEKFSYWVNEIKAPDLYNKQKNTVDGATPTDGDVTNIFNVTDGNTVEVVFINSRDVKSYLRVSKILNAYNGSLIENRGPFLFQIKDSNDVPVNLNGRIFGDDQSQSLKNYSDGVFALRSYGSEFSMAYIEVDSNETYSVTEISREPYATYYAKGEWEYIGAVWTPTWTTYNYSDMKWLKNKGNVEGATAEIRTSNADMDYDLLFVNVEIPELQITKNVGSGGNKSDTFEFEIYSGENIVPLTSEPANAAGSALLTRITALNDAELNNRITAGNSLLLADGETATVVNLRPGEYTIVEKGNNGYTTKFSVNGASSTGTFTLGGITKVNVTNSVTGPDTPRPSTPRGITPNADGGGGGGGDKPNDADEPKKPDTPVYTNNPGVSDTSNGVQEISFNTVDDADNDIDLLGIGDDGSPGAGMEVDFAGMGITRAPQTGDDRNNYAVVVLLVGVSCVIGAEYYRRRKLA